ncbi:hypothetical protein HHK36_011793 [Tetracentron sinense]|uniref:Peptidase A1 domain-containing protein n=1 Tax=Tetracentron sinense TaxID=13715 RepID=A0A834Z916_TETSI|nr:hypothetical protein HHK36_011793 [Tetracentron sinense]
MAGSTTLPLIALLISLISLSSSFPSPQKSSTIGFQARLIHSNSPLSPLYNPTATPSDRIRAAVANSFSRHHSLESSKSRGASPDWVQAPVRPYSGVYVLSYYIGTPATETFAIVDTASDLIWLQCLPCVECYKQIDPIFDPTKSSSYRKIQCSEPECHAIPTTNCKTDKEDCLYGLVYQDTSSSQGVLSSETMIFGNTPSGNYTLLNIAFGCGHNNSETGDENNAPGVVGLNNQSLSLLSQVGMNHFSYCLVPLEEGNIDSPIKFGQAAEIIGDKTPILEGGEKHFYYLGLQGISVEDERLPIPAGTFNVTADGSGGFIVDSGTSYTLLNSNVHAMLIKEMVNNTNLPRVDDATELFELCYDCSSDEIELAASITFHFTGVDLVLSTMNKWTDNGDGLYCLAILPTTGLSILGLHQQQNINIGFDVEKNVVSFEPKDCTSVG